MRFLLSLRLKVYKLRRKSSGRRLDSCKFPTLLYVNKMDRIGADPLRVINEIHRLMSKEATAIQAYDGVEGEFAGVIDLLELGNERSKGISLSCSAVAERIQMLETIAEQDNELLSRYFDQGKLSDLELLPVLKTCVRQSELFPVLFGASNKGIGVDKLMNAIVTLLPPPAGDETAPLSGVVFKLEKDPIMGRIAYVRLYGGILRNRDAVHNHGLNIDEKITQIRRVEGQKSEDVGTLVAGDIAAVCGWSRVRIGDIIGSTEGVPGEQRLAVPLLTVQVEWQNEAEYPAVVAAFHEMADEDPHLDVQWLQDDRELHLRVMGPIQVEVLGQMLLSRYGLEVNFSAPSVIYKETPKQKAEGFVAYTMPKPCSAILRFVIEPGERGSGLQYRSLVRSESLLDSYQNEVARRVPRSL